VRHTRPSDYVELTTLLDELRRIDGLVEKNQGVFHRGSKAFLHFHVHDDDFYADVRLDGTAFARMRVTTKSEQRALLSAIRKTVRS
jgi:hypothetical protein